MKNQAEIKTRILTFIGAELQGFKVGKNLGSGSFGLVFSAVHATTGQPAAIKFLASRECYEKEVTVMDKI